MPCRVTNFSFRCDWKYDRSVRVRRLPIQLDRRTFPCVPERPMSNTLLRRSLGTKLRLAILGTTLAALALALAATIVYDLRTWHRGWIGDLQAQADLLGHASADELAAGNPRGAQDTLAALRLQPRLRNAAIYDAQGRLFAGWHAGGYDAPPATLARVDTGAAAAASHDLQVH